MPDRKPWFLEQMIVTGGTILVVIGIWLLSFFVMVKTDLPPDYIMIGLIAGPVGGAFWHAFSSSRWRQWLKLHLPENEKDTKPQDLGDIIQSAEAFLTVEALGFIQEFKASFPDFDTSTIDEIKEFVSNLRATFSATGALTSHYINPDEIDQLIERLHRDTDTLKGRQWGEVREWLYVVSGLTERLVQIKAAVRK